MGLAATLDQFGQTAEVSSTVYSQMVMKMFQETSTYARLAQMNVKDFAALLNTDVNEAFIRVLDGLRGNDKGMQAVVDSLGDMELEGKRSIAVLGVLSANTEVLRKQQLLANQEFEKGTSLTNEFQIQNNTAQAQVDKYRKHLELLRRELGENLQPAYAGALKMSGLFLNILSPLAEFITKNATAIIAAASGLALYTIKSNLATIANSQFVESLKKLWKVIINCNSQDLF
jgi:TP901 family phage tail tape measure protein